MRLKTFFKITGSFAICSLVPAASAQTIPEAIDDILDRSSTIDLDMGVLFENEDGSIQYYSKNPEVPMVPASNMKMFTTAAAYGLLGENYAFETTVYYTGTFSSGNISGDLILLGEHDPTWNTSTLSEADDALDIIAQKVVSAGVTSISGDIRGMGAMTYGRGSTNVGHNSLAATDNENQNVVDRFLLELTTRGITVSGSASGETGFTPPGGSTQLVNYLSTESNYRFGGPLDLAEICIPLNKVSHNPMADYMLRHIGYTQAGSDTYSAGETEVINWLQNTPGIDTTGIIINDGSGLNNDSKVSARQTVDLTRYMANNHPSWVTTLPISGVDGTISGRLTSIPGDVKAKTGTLGNSGSIALSGLIDSDIDGQRYFFSWYNNTEGLTAGGTQSIDTTNARDVTDDSIIEFVESYPPVSVDTRAVTKLDSSTVRVEWDDNAIVGDSYTVQVGNAGGSFTDVATVSSTYIIESGNDNDSDGLNNSDYSDSGPFANSSSHSNASGLTTGVGSRFIVPTDGNGTATFTPSGLAQGRYRVDVTCFDFSSADAHNVEVQITDRVNDPTPSSAFFDLSEDTAGNTWRSVGTIDFIPGQGHKVEFLNNAQTSTGSNDRMNPAAVRFIPLFADIPLSTFNSNRDVRIVVNGPRGLPSEVSETFSFYDANALKVLIIDGYDRWDTIVDNANRDSHDFVAIHADAIENSLSSLQIESASNDAVIDGQINLADYAAVIWVLGEESTVDETFSDEEQALVSSYINESALYRNMFISGSEIAWDLDRDSGPSASDRAFLNNVLGADFGSNANDDANTYDFQPVSSSSFALISGSLVFDDGTGPTYDVTFPDVLLPQSGVGSIFEYVGGTGGVAGVMKNYPSGNLLYMGFGFETILDELTRNDIMFIFLRDGGLTPIDNVSDWWAFK